MLRQGIPVRLILGVVVALFTVFSYYSKNQVNPITGESQHISISPDEEIALGLNSAPQMAQEFGGLYQDARVQQAVKAIGNMLVQRTEAKNSPYRFDFHVLADPQTINAFALPGGQVFITMGLLTQLEGNDAEDQIAGVLGHEIGHVIGRHSAEHMAQQELTTGLIGAAQVATNPSSGQMAAFVGNMIGMKFGRADELESDHFGIKYMMQSGYNPEAMLKVMEVLARAGGGKQQSEFMSTHPSPENRVAKIKEAIAEFKAQGIGN